MQALSSYGLTDRDTQTIFEILQKYSKVENVLLFGSRAKGIFHKGSDLDLAINDKDISFKTLCKIKSDFEESSLPYRVDIVDINAITNNELLKHIQRVGKPIRKLFSQSLA